MVDKHKHYYDSGFSAANKAVSINLMTMKG